MVVKLSEEHMKAQKYITLMEKAVVLCESRIPELSHESTRHLDIAYYHYKDIYPEAYYKDKNKISELANKFSHKCSCK